MILTNIKKSGKLNEATATYPDGHSLTLFLSNDKLEQYRITQELLALGATEKMINRFFQIAYRAGKADGKHS